MNKRDIKKISTKENILKETNNMICKYGFISCSLKMIADVLGISQGTIILHFKSKKDLYYKILVSNLDEMENEFTKMDESPIPNKKYIDYMIEIFGKKEKILRSIYRDYFHLDENMRNRVDTFESILKNALLDHVRSNTSSRIHIVNIFTSIDAFYNQIKAYICSEETNDSSLSILAQKRARLYKLYSLLFEMKV